MFSESGVSLRVLPGPFWSQVAESLTDASWRVARESNRMGIRLHANITWQLPHDLPSSPVCPGTIQATASGQLLVLGVDGPTIGGYPRVGYVIQADWDILGQLRPEQTVCFVPITLEQAYRLARQLTEWRRQSTLRLLITARTTTRS
ncbi:KipI antagonist [bacterium HR36]|nr:KipI antagonist [bacterium HR36]